MDRIDGIIVPTAWDSDGKIIALGIAAGDEQEYLIENQRQIDSLLTLLRQEVVVMGSIKYRKDHKVVKIAHICTKKMD